MLQSSVSSGCVQTQCRSVVSWRVGCGMGYMYVSEDDQGEGVCLCVTGGRTVVEATCSSDSVVWGRVWRACPIPVGRAFRQQLWGGLHCLACSES